MANVAGGAGRFVLKHGPTLVMKYGPSLMKAAQNVREFVKEHPTIPSWVQARLNDIATQTDTIRKRRGDAAQIRGMVDLVRTQALSSDVSGDVAAWVKRADTIELRVGMTEKLSQPLQKTTLAAIKQEAEALLAEFIGALAYVPPTP